MTGTVPVPQGQDLGRPRILMVDDRPDALLALEVVLEPLGAELVAAHSGLEALQELLAGDFAVIILDVQMPEIDGFETARLIRMRERSRHIPIVFLTAISGEPQHFMAGYEAGGFDYLYKPYDPALLRAKITVLLRLWEKDMVIARQHAELELQLGQLQEAHSIVQRQAAELERSNAALERVAEVSAAGMRRPLCLATGFLQLALAGKGTQDEDSVERAGRALARAKQALDDVRQTARARTPPTPLSSVDLQAMVTEVANQLKPRFPLCHFVANDLPAVDAEPEMLRLLLCELLEASAERAPEGTVRVSASPQEGAWQLSVIDDGPVASPTWLLRGLTTFGDGPGAGSLGMARRMADRRGGSVGAQAAPGQGTALWVRLPLDNPGPDGPRGPGTRPGTAPAASGKA